MVYPPLSPDLNIVVLVWDYMKKSLKYLNPQKNSGNLYKQQRIGAT